MTSPARIAHFLDASKGYMMETATNAVVENHLEPIGKTESTQPLVVTGQGLYDTFMVADTAEVTRMDFIRSLVDTADALQIKGATDALVEKARLIDYPNGKPKKADRGPKEQQAMNVRTLVQQAWGALKHAREALDADGYTEQTGYQAMRVLAKRALDVSGKTWQGFDVPSEADRAAKAAQRRNKEETKALVEVQKDNPRLPQESLADWNTRVFALAETAMEEAKENADTESANKEIERIFEKFGAEVAQKIVVGLLERLDSEAVESIAFAALESLGIEYHQSEISEEEADALLMVEGAKEEQHA